MAVKKGIELDLNIVTEKLKYLDQLSADVTASMQHDLRTGNRLELPWLAGTVVDLGKELGVATPVCDTLTGHTFTICYGRE